MHATSHTTQVDVLLVINNVHTVFFFLPAAENMLQPESQLQVEWLTLFLGK